jgi:hypothetical protein
VDFTAYQRATMSLPPDARFVTLEIVGPGVDPAAVPRQLGIEPTLTSDPSSATDTLPTSPWWGVWVVDTRGRVMGRRLADHLRWLADRLSGGPALSDVAAGRARLFAQGGPETWDRDASADENERARPGLPLSFVVFVKGDSRVKVGHVEFRDRDDTA